MFYFAIHRVFVSALGTTNHGNCTAQASRLGCTVRLTRLLVGVNCFLARTVLLGGNGCDVRLRGANVMLASCFKRLQFFFRHENHCFVGNGLILVSFVVHRVVNLRRVCFLNGLLNRLFGNVLVHPDNGNVFVCPLSKKNQCVRALSICLPTNGRDHRLVRRANGIFQVGGSYV